MHSSGGHLLPSPVQPFDAADAATVGQRFTRRSRRPVLPAHERQIPVTVSHFFGGDETDRVTRPSTSRLGLTRAVGTET